jgi:hypothetical protein
MNFGYLTTFQSLDKGLIERLGPTGFTVSTFSLSFNYTNVNSGLLYHTAFSFVIFALLFTVFLSFGTFDFLWSFSVAFSLLFISYFAFLFLEA